jgi:hypothetical protein
METSMNNETNAGALILSQLGHFCEAQRLMEREITPKFYEAIDQLTESYCDSQRWVGVFELADDDDCWLAPSEWNLADRKKPTCIATFKIDCIEDDDDYWLALFCGVGGKSGKAGFKFSVNYSHFGGVRKCEKLFAQFDPETVKELTTLEFKQQGKWEFFLPIRLDSDQLALAWKAADGAGATDLSRRLSEDDSLGPIREALGNLKKSIPLFNTILGKHIPIAPSSP